MSIKLRAGRTKSLSALIGKDSSNLSNILTRVDLLDQLDTLLNNNLPSNLHNLYRVANYKDGCLILFTPTATNLTHWRFVSAKILANLQQKLPTLQKIEVKVRPQAPKRVNTNKPLPISVASAEKLSDLAADTDNPRLKAALLKLASKASSNK